MQQTPGVSPTINPSVPSAPRALGSGRGRGTWGNRNLRHMTHDQRPGTTNPLPSLDQLPLLHPDDGLRVRRDLLQQLPPREGERVFMSSNGPPSGRNTPPLLTPHAPGPFPPPNQNL